VFIFITRALLY